MSINVICKSSKERTKEIEELFEKMKPYLINGKSYSQALSIVKNTKTRYNHTRWFKELVEYGESQGFPKENFEYENTSGFLNVNLRKYDSSLTGYYWVYKYTDKYGVRRRLMNDDLIKLKERIENSNLIWEITNEFWAIQSIELNKKLQKNKKPSKKKNHGRNSSSGVKYVSKISNKHAKKGYYWVYNYDGLVLQATSLNKLKDRISEVRGLWIILDNDIYMNNIDNDY